MYGLSLTASLVCASATFLFASATFLAKSSVMESDLAGGVSLGFGAGVAGVGGATIVADEGTLNALDF
jgi:hypothetical protein